MGMDGTDDDFIAFKLRQNQRKTTPQTPNFNGSFESGEWHQEHEKNLEKSKDKSKSDMALNGSGGGGGGGVSRSQKRSFDLGAERPGPTSIGKLKLSSEMRQRLEKVTAGHSVRSTKSTTSYGENQPIKLDESRKLMLEEQLRGKHHVRSQIQKMEASKIQKPFMPLPSVNSKISSQTICF